MKLRVEPPPEKKKRKTKTKTKTSLPPSFSLLPDEITVSYLARISRSYYPKLSIVSKSFHSLLFSNELYVERSRLGIIDQYLYICLTDFSHHFPQWYRLSIHPNPNRTLPKSSVTTKNKNKKKTVGHLMVLVPPPSNIWTPSGSTVVVGSEIYVMQGVSGSRSSKVQILDCRSDTWRNAPNMKVARENAFSCVYDGKIYVLGGCKDEPWAEVFDIKTQTWEPLPEPCAEIRNCGIKIIAEIQGKIMFGDIYNIYAYDTKQGKWESFENGSAMFPKSQCVIENVSYCHHGKSMCDWYDIMDGNWKEVKGLVSLRKKYWRSGGSSHSNRKLVSFGGKLLIVWLVYKRRKPNVLMNFWCAEIVLEKRDGGEVWGNVEWVDVVQTIPTACQLLHCLGASV